jgi:uncharacterized protein (TIGR02145 family)
MRHLVTFLILSSVILFSGCKKEQGCTNPQACNFSQSAEEDDGSCYLPGDSCDDNDYTTYDDSYNSSCDCIGILISFGCTDNNACNYIASANTDNGSCEYEGDSCDDGNFTTLNDSWSNNCVCEGDICEGNIYHDGYEYSIIQIGQQCWFAENCRYLPEVSPSSEGSRTEPYYYVYGIESTDLEYALASSPYETSGVLYNWPAVMAAGICPSGWHIPSDEEFTQLRDNFLGGNYVAGGKMKEAGYDHWPSPNTGATNSSGWTGLPGGMRSSSGGWFNADYGQWWSSSEYDFGNNSDSWSYKLHYDNEWCFRYADYKGGGFSARCVRD